MPITTGIDIVNVERIKKIVEEKGTVFLKRIFSDEEVAYCEEKVSRHQHYAARFAAKEAFIKALHDSTPLLTYKDIEVRKNGQVPFIYINDENKKKCAKIKSMSLSIAHEREFAVASVVIEKG